MSTPSNDIWKDFLANKQRVWQENPTSRLPIANFLKRNPSRSRESPYSLSTTSHWFPEDVSGNLVLTSLLPKPFKFMKGNLRRTSRTRLNYSSLIKPMGFILYYIMLLLIIYLLGLLTVAHVVTFYEQKKRGEGHSSCHQDT